VRLPPIPNRQQRVKTMKHQSVSDLEVGLEEILRSPKNNGVVEMIVRRPGVDKREVLEQGELDIAEGLIGDSWRIRGRTRMPDGSAHPEIQLTIMNSRVVALVATTKERWPLAGDQLYVDLDLSKDNLPPGTLLELGTAVVEVSSVPHTGCKKFVERFGLDAMTFVNSRRGKMLGLRGINAKVVKSGGVCTKDIAKKVS